MPWLWCHLQVILPVPNRQWNTCLCMDGGEGPSSCGLKGMSPHVISVEKTPQPMTEGHAITEKITLTSLSAKLWSQQTLSLLFFFENLCNSNLIAINKIPMEKHTTSNSLCLICSKISSCTLDIQLQAFQLNLIFLKVKGLPKVTEKSIIIYWWGCWGRFPTHTGTCRPPQSMLSDLALLSHLNTNTQAVGRRERRGEDRRTTLWLSTEPRQLTQTGP